MCFRWNTALYLPRTFYDGKYAYEAFGLAILRKMPSSFMWQCRSGKPIFYEIKPRQCLDQKFHCECFQPLLQVWSTLLGQTSLLCPMVKTHYYFSSKWILWDESGSAGTWPKRASPKQNQSKECTPHQELSTISIRFLLSNASPPYLHSVHSQKVCCGTDLSQFDHSLILGSVG